MMALASHSATAAHWTRQQYEAALGEEPQPRVFWVMEDDSVVHGFLVGRRIDLEWEIENIAVAGPARRRGLGSRLVGEFISLARAQGAQVIYLEVRESNQAARMLYEKWAFVERGRRKSYYRDPQEDAVLYRMDFS